MGPIPTLLSLDSRPIGAVQALKKYGYIETLDPGCSNPDPCLVFGVKSSFRYGPEVAPFRAMIGHGKYISRKDKGSP